MFAEIVWREVCSVELFCGLRKKRRNSSPQFISTNQVQHQDVELSATADCTAFRRRLLATEQSLLNPLTPRFCEPRSSNSYCNDIPLVYLNQTNVNKEIYFGLSLFINSCRDKPCFSISYCSFLCTN